MNYDEKIMVDGFEIDRNRVTEIMRTIIALETTNIKTKELSDSKMAQKIIDTIEEVVKCY